MTTDDLTDGHTYKSLMAAQKAKIAFLKRFETQGYYATASGDHIPLEELESRVAIVEIK